MGQDKKSLGKNVKARHREVASKVRHAQGPKGKSRKTGAAGPAGKLKDALQREAAIAEILRMVASSPSNIGAVFEAIAARSNKLVNGHSTSVYRLDKDVLHVAAFTSRNEIGDAVPAELFPRPVKDFPGLDKLIREALPVQIEDTEVRLADEPAFLEISRRRGFRSLVCVPLLHNSTTIGVISVTRAKVGSFSDDHLRLLQIFADQAAIAIENERLSREAQKRTDDLAESLRHQTATAEVLKVISRATFDLPIVLHALIETAAQLCEADKGTITRQKGGTFYRAESYGLSERFTNFVRAVPVVVDRHTATGRALLEGSVVHIPDVETDRDFIFSEGQRLGDFRSLLGVPMLRQGLPIGVITLIRTEPRAFTDKQIELAITFADQAAIAIQNVTLFEEVQTRTRELSKSLDDLRTAQNRLIQTEKLASLGQLTAGIAHEIKNPLNFVNNFSALSAELTDELNVVLASATLTGKICEEVEELTGLLKDNMQKVVLHGKRADSIVKNMLLHSREGSGDHRPADVNALVEESLNLAYHGARAEKPQFNVKLTRHLDPAAGMIEVFPQEITRVLLNLISNSFYAATRPKNENDMDFESMLSATTRDRGEHVEIRIRDNGIGIPPEVKEKIFNPFFTTKPAGEGTGLGLSMSHDIIVKQHGGTIDVESSPGEFTEFTILLPRKSNFSDKSGGQL